MTDLTAKCPKCKKKTTNYFHFIDSFGIGTAIPDGTYDMICQEYYIDQKEEDYCGNEFKVKVTNSKKIKVIQ